MAQHVWSVICARSIIDSDSNNISLIDVLEQLTVGPLPEEPGTLVIPVNFEVVTLWSRSNHQGGRWRSRLVMITPQGTNHASAPMDVDLTRFERVRNRARTMGLQYEGPGRYEFRIELQEDGEWRQVGTAFFNVILADKGASENQNLN